MVAVAWKRSSRRRRRHVRASSAIYTYRHDAYNVLIRAYTRTRACRWSAVITIFYRAFRFPRTVLPRCRRHRRRWRRRRRRRHRQQTLGARPYVSDRSGTSVGSGIVHGRVRRRTTPSSIRRPGRFSRTMLSVGMYDRPVLKTPSSSIPISTFPPEMRNILCIPQCTLPRVVQLLCIIFVPAEFARIN